MSPSRPSLRAWLFVPFLAGCPSSVDSQRADSANDKRLTAGAEPDDLAAGSSAEGPRPGVGAPDERNGVCRLFAERFPEPACCPRTYGIGVEEVASICGYEVFLGEYVREGCRYSFYDSTQGVTTWIKLALLADTRPLAEIVEDSDKWIRKRKRDEGFSSTTLPGDPSVAYNLANPVGWSLLAGWKMHRQATWRKGFCGDNIEALLRQVANAPEPDKDAGGFRRGLLPAASSPTTAGAATGGASPAPAAAPAANPAAPPQSPAD